MNINECRSQNNFGFCMDQLRRHGTSGKPPYHKPTRYIREEIKATHISGTNSPDYIGTVTRLFSDEYWRAAQNEATRKFMDDVFAANMSNNIAQIEQTYGMIAGRSASLLNAARLIRRGRIIDGLSSLVSSPRKPGQPGAARDRKRNHLINSTSRKTLAKRESAFRRGAYTAADAWTEYHYGWSPLYDDMTGAINALRGLGSRKKKITKTGKDTRITDTSSMQVTQHGSALVGGYMKQDLPAVLQLGVHQVPSAAWELLPFSFVIDAFIPIRTWLYMQDPTVMSNLSDTWSNIRVDLTGKTSRKVVHEGRLEDRITEYSGYYFSRAPGIGLSMAINNPLTGALRAGHYTALLIQQLRRFS